MGNKGNLSDIFDKIEADKREAERRAEEWRRTAKER